MPSYTHPSEVSIPHPSSDARFIPSISGDAWNSPFNQSIYFQ